MPRLRMLTSTGYRCGPRERVEDGCGRLISTLADATLASVAFLVAMVNLLSACSSPAGSRGLVPQIRSSPAATASGLRRRPRSRRSRPQAILLIILILTAVLLLLAALTSMPPRRRPQPPQGDHQRPPHHPGPRNPRGLAPSQEPARTPGQAGNPARPKDLPSTAQARPSRARHPPISQQPHLWSMLNSMDIMPQKRTVAAS